MGIRNKAPENAVVGLAINALYINLIKLSFPIIIAGIVALKA